MLGVQDVDLSSFVALAEEEVLSYCNITTVPESFYGAVLPAIVAMRYNASKGAGLVSASYSGISETYAQDYPAHIKAILNRYRRAVIL